MPLYALLVAVSLAGCARQFPDPGPWPAPTTSAAAYAADSAVVADAILAARRESARTSPVPFYLPDSFRVERLVLIHGPDHRCLFAAVVFGAAINPEEAPPDGVLRSHLLQAYHGVRDSVGGPWSLYLDPTFGGTSGSEERADLLLRTQFLDRIVGQEVAVAGPTGADYAAIEHTVDDPGWWTGVMWTEGTRLPGLYLFQTDQTGGTSGERPFELRAPLVTAAPPGAPAPAP